MGTPLYGRYILEKLCKIVDVSLVVCQPDKPSGRDKRIEIGEVKKYSQENNLDIWIKSAKTAEKFKKDKELVLLAVNQNWSSYKFADFRSHHNEHLD